MASRRDSKVKKDAEADAKMASAAKASSESLRRAYERQAQVARKEALRESNTIASLSKDLAKIGADIGGSDRRRRAPARS